MAKYERRLPGRFDEVLRLCDQAVMGGSMSASYEDGSDLYIGDVRVAVRVYERYSAFGGNRVSLSLTLAGRDGEVSVVAVTAGGSQAMFFKMNTMGEASFLDTLASALDRQYPVGY